MLIGTNFLRSMNGGVRIEGNEVTIYKKITKIQTLPQAEVSAAINQQEQMNQEDAYSWEDIYTTMHECYMLESPQVGMNLAVNC